MELILNSSSKSSSLTDFGLPLPNSELLALLHDRLLMEERCYDRQKLGEDSRRMVNNFHPDQLAIYNLVMAAVTSEKQILVFVYGHGGTGKTYLWTTIKSSLRASGKVVLAVASSGIACLLLPSGRTAHSRFKIPLDLSNESVCDVKKNTLVATLLFETSVIIWDEAPMSDRKCFESLDRTLRDIMKVPSLLFGGKSVLLGGDFRQTLPVKPKASKIDIIDSSLPRSYLWSHFKVCMLKENLRLHRLDMYSIEAESVRIFSKWLLDIGDGKVGLPLEADVTDAKLTTISPQFLIKPGENALDELISFIYDRDAPENPRSASMADKAIVCPKNDDADTINERVLSMTNGECETYLSVDSMVPHSKNDGITDITYLLNNEMLTIEKVYVMVQDYWRPNNSNRNHWNIFI